MIAVADKASRKPRMPRWHKKFLQMLPLIRRHAAVSFRHLDREARAEAVQEVICNALAAFRRLVELGKADVAYASPLARYAVAQVRAGRRVGAELNCKDVGSLHCRHRNGVYVESLDHFDEEQDCWEEVLIEDKTAGPAEIAASRVDFADWMQTLPSRQQRIANLLATGMSTKATARRFHVTPGRVAQLRRELMQSWYQFVGEAAPVPA